MRAAVYEAFGAPEVVTIREVPRPVPRKDEVLIRVHTATVSAADWRLRSREVPAGFGLIVRLAFGWSKPKHAILGMDAAGVVVEVGKAVERFTPGQAVYAMLGPGGGGHAEYVCVKQDAAIAQKPDAFSFEEAAALCFGGTTALHFLRSAALEPGERVLVNGASGAVGSAAVQLAKHMGAHVTGVCSEARAATVRGLGADEVLDHAREDFASRGQRYDVILDAVGNAPFARCRGALNRGGRLLAVVAGMPTMLLAPWVSLTTDKRLIVGSAPESADDLRELGRLAAEGSFRPLIGERFPLERIVEAHRRVDSGHKLGNVVLTMTAD